LYHHLVRQIKRCTAHQPLRHTSVVRLALVVTGIMTARSCVLRQIAAELLALGLTGASTAESVGRRLRRTLNDHRLTVETTYRPLVQQVVGWEGLRRGGQPAVLLVDESSNAEQVHLFRVSLAYRGGALPLAWALWPQNQAQPQEAYWQQVDRVLAEVAELLPAGLTVIVLADRAYDVPAFLDRLAAYGWSWIVRCKARGQLRFRDRQGREQRLGTLVRTQLPAAGGRWKGAGWAFKKAGWRPVSVVAIWAAGMAEPLVLLTNLPPAWQVAKLYQRRSWIEASFRQDKRKGWQWEDSQVVDLAHHERLMLALAWASLVTLCLGVEVAEQHLQQQRRKPPRRAQHPRESLFTLGLHRVKAWCYQRSGHRLRWHLPDVHAESWTDQWLGMQRHQHILQPVRP